MPPFGQRRQATKCSQKRFPFNNVGPLGLRKHPVITTSSEGVPFLLCWCRQPGRVPPRPSEMWPVLGARVDGGQLRRRDRALRDAVRPRGRAQRTTSTTTKCSLHSGPRPRLYHRAPDVRAGARCLAMRGRHRKCPLAPRMRPGAGGCQGDGSFQEPLVLAVGCLEVSRCGP